jgi:cadmium resistance protein CadD (predicted permease)
MKRPASLVAAILFFVMAIAQLCRLFLQVHIVAGDITVPLWPSALAAVVLILLGIWLLVERSK